eukprot:scaffold186_cov257-Pinguiococcus_pyrenoidosus.AAC.2
MADHLDPNVQEPASPGDTAASYPKRLEGTFDTVMAPPDMRTSAGSTISSISAGSASSLAGASFGCALDVFLRVRPPPADMKENADATTIDFRSGSTILHRSGSGKQTEYTFSGVLNPAASQEDVYQRVAAPLVEGLIEGRNGLLFAYGVTNSGKTYSINGNKESPGIIPRSLGQILGHLASERGRAANVLTLRYLEIYNEQVYDLLAEPDDAITGKKKALRLAQGASGGVEVKGLTSFPVSSIAEGMRLVDEGGRNRRCGSTGLNSQSSRSHSVLCIELKRPDHAKPAVLWITDLAGSERSARTGVRARGSRQNEANAINKSLMLVSSSTSEKLKGWPSTGRACESLLTPQLLPFRTALPLPTQPLAGRRRSHLNGVHATGRTVMLVCVSPMAADFSETQHVLQNSNLAQQVCTAPDERQIKRNGARLRATHGVDGRRLPPKRPHLQAFPESRLPDAKRGSGESGGLSPRRHDPASASASASTVSSAASAQIVEENARLQKENVYLKDELERTIEALQAAKEGQQEQEVRIRSEVAVEWSERIDSLQREWKARMLAETAAKDPEQQDPKGGMAQSPKGDSGGAMGKQPFPMSRVAMSTRKANEAKLVAYITELEEGRAEVEDEMERVRKRHDEEVTGLRNDGARIAAELQEHKDLLSGSRAEVKELYSRMSAQGEELKKLREALRQAQIAASRGTEPAHASKESPSDFSREPRQAPVLDVEEALAATAGKVDKLLGGGVDGRSSKAGSDRKVGKTKKDKAARTPIANRLRSRVRNVFRK